MPIFTTNSHRWQIFNAVTQALETAPALQGVPVVRNPTSSLRVGSGEYCVVVRWNTDTLTEKPGQRERRRFQLLVGSIANTDTADQDADALHLQVGEVVRLTLTELAQGQGVGVMREGDVVPDLDSILVEGALVLSNWEIQYQKPVSAYEPN